LATALAQVVLTGGATTSYAGILTMVYYDAASKKVYSLNAGYNTVLEEKDPLTIPIDYAALARIDSGERVKCAGS
jgi:gamma-glutamyltranspeptidase/glutathione hydrolase